MVYWTQWNLDQNITTVAEKNNFKISFPRCWSFVLCLNVLKCSMVEYLHHRNLTLWWFHSWSTHKTPTLSGRCYCEKGNRSSHKTYNAFHKYPIMHHFVIGMCTHVHISATKWCIVGHGTGALLDLLNRSITARGHCHFVFLRSIIAESMCKVDWWVVEGTTHLKQHSCWMAIISSGLKVFEIAFQDVPHSVNCQFCALRGL